MNGTKKFHKPTGPAFAVGEQWVSIAGKIKCKILSVRKYGEGKWDYEATYEYTDGSQASKDAWSFQVRYAHVADQNL